MRRRLRLLLGLGLGGGALAALLRIVGPAAVLGRVSAVAPSVVAAVAALVVAEAVVDGLGVWASVRPLNGGLSARRSVQFALAGDFLDALGPAGPVTSEPIVARFLAVATGTGYGEALGVRTVAKYVKSVAQLLLSVILVAGLLAAGTAPRAVGLALAGATVALAVAGVVAVSARDRLARLVVGVLAPVVVAVSRPDRGESRGRDVVADGVARFRTRAGEFRDAPGLLALVAAGGLLEQALTAGALWVTLSGLGAEVAPVVLVALVPLPRAASVVPVPGSLGAYDLLLASGLVAVAGVTGASAAAAVLVVRTLGLGVSFAAGGPAVAILRVRRS